MISTSFLVTAANFFESQVSDPPPPPSRDVARSARPHLSLPQSAVAIRRAARPTRRPPPAAPTPPAHSAAQNITTPSKIWLTLFFVHSTLLPVMGILDFMEASRDPTSHTPHSPHLQVMGILDFMNYEYEQYEPDVIEITPYSTKSTAYAIEQGDVQAESYVRNIGTRQTPMVPWAFVAYLDYGWFVLLGLTVVFLPDSPPLYIEMTLAYDRSLGDLGSGSTIFGDLAKAGPISKLKELSPWKSPGKATTPQTAELTASAPAALPSGGFEEVSFTPADSAGAV